MEFSFFTSECVVAFSEVHNLVLSGLVNIDLLDMVVFLPCNEFFFGDGWSVDQAVD